MRRYAYRYQDCLADTDDPNDLEYGDQRVRTPKASDHLGRSAMFNLDFFIFKFKFKICRHFTARYHLLNAFSKISLNLKKIWLMGDIQRWRVMMLYYSVLLTVPIAAWNPWNPILNIKNISRILNLQVTLIYSSFSDFIVILSC